MSKYVRLRDFLRRKPELEWNARFDEIETVVGFSLPESASIHRSWWANSGGKAAHQRAWLDAGWNVVSADPSRRTVSFRRSRVSDAALMTPTASNGVVAPTSTKSPIPASQSNALTVRIDWEARGQIKKGLDGQLQFPSLPEDPGLMRFRLKLPQGTATLILDAPSLVGAASRYGRGIALNGIVLSEATDIELDIAGTRAVWLVSEGRGRAVDLADDALRKFARQAAQLSADAAARRAAAPPAA